MGETIKLFPINKYKNNKVVSSGLNIWISSLDALILWFFSKFSGWISWDN